jgi:hypothetical protein
LKRSQNLNEAPKWKVVYFITYFWFDSFHEVRQQRFFIFAPRSDFGYASKPNCLASVVCSDFQATTVRHIWVKYKRALLYIRKITCFKSIQHFSFSFSFVKRNKLFQNICRIRSGKVWLGSYDPTKYLNLGKILAEIYFSKRP